MNPHIELKLRLEPGAQAPRYASPGAAGADLHAYLPRVRRITIPPQSRIMVPTGVFLELPPFHEAQIRPRSGLAFSAGLTVLNAPGTIDSDYRGEIKIILHNTSKDELFLLHGDRIAQMVIAPVMRGTFLIVDDLANTERGSGGFGSTGTS